MRGTRVVNFWNALCNAKNLKVIEMQYNPETNRLLSRALSRPVFTALARGEDTKNIFKGLYDANLIPSDKTLDDLFKLAYDNSHSNYRNEYVYKSAIVNKIIFGRHSPRTASLLIELPVGKSIVDAAVFNGTSTAYEVKTEFDSPRRLATQTPDYLKVFDQVYIVTHPDFAKNYISEIDERVGILSLDTKDRIKTIRAAVQNRANTDPKTTFRTLRRNEYVSALESITGEKISLPNGIISNHCEKIFTSLSQETIHNIFVSAMRKRTTDIDTINFVSALPKHLRVLGYSAQLSTPQRKRVLDRLNNKLI